MIIVMTIENPEYLVNKFKLSNYLHINVIIYYLCHFCLLSTLQNVENCQMLKFVD